MPLGQLARPSEALDLTFSMAAPNRIPDSLQLGIVLYFESGPTTGRSARGNANPSGAFGGTAGITLWVLRLLHSKSEWRFRQDLTIGGGRSVCS